MAIDFRLRPPYGTFLNVGMYKDKTAADFYANNTGMVRPESAKKESMPMLFEEMAANDIELGVITGRIGHRKGNVPNDVIIELVQKYPDRFVGLAGLDSTHPNESIEELHRVCVNGPLKGVVLEPGAQEKPMYADDGRLYPIYAECEKYNIPIQIMIGGRSGPDRSYSKPSIISHIAADFPNATFIVAHACWPFVQEVLGVCFYQENIYLAPDLYFFNLPGQDDYIRAANYFMKDRFLFASAYPFIPLSCINSVKKLLNPDVLPNILFKNAQKVLRL